MLGSPFLQPVLVPFPGDCLKGVLLLRSAARLASFLASPGSDPWASNLRACAPFTCIGQSHVRVYAQGKEFFLSPSSISSASICRHSAELQGTVLHVSKRRYILSLALAFLTLCPLGSLVRVLLKQFHSEKCGQSLSDTVSASTLMSVSIVKVPFFG